MSFIRTYGPGVAKLGDISYSFKSENCLHIMFGVRPSGSADSWQRSLVEGILYFSANSGSGQRSLV